MGFATLALVCAVGLAGPLLALPRRLQVPVVVGELAAGIVLGQTGFRVLHAHDPTFTFLADIGFALVMFVAGSHVPVGDPRLRAGLVPAIARDAAIGVVATGIAYAVSAVFGTGHVALYAVLMSSSSAALVLPIMASLTFDSGPALGLLPQVAVADTACIVALPLAVDPAHAPRAALGALAVAGSAVLLFLVLRHLERSGVRRRVHQVSRQHSFAVEMRVNLAVVFALAAVAVRTHVSILLAGFAFGLVVAAIGEPRRLARQLFAVTEGFLGPLFFVWLGASLDIRALGGHPSFIALGVALGVGAVIAHTAMRAAGQPVALGALAAAQLGVPVAAATLGTQTGLLRPGEAPALVLGALVTITVATVAGGVAGRAGLTKPA